LAHNWSLLASTTVGWMGVKCEHKVEICGDNEHACFFGGKCVKDGDNHACDCQAAFTAFDKIAGTYCQHKSTTICTKNSQPATGNSNFAFCVNNGKCRDTVDSDDEHPGCICPQVSRSSVWRQWDFCLSLNSLIILNYLLSVCRVSKELIVNTARAK
jgi:hypothetical protein